VSRAVEGATTATLFESYIERLLTPTLKRGQIIVVDNLNAHKGERVRELIEERGFKSFCTCHLTHRTSTPYRGSLLEDQGIVAQRAGTKPRSPC
jgi:hypothetical protein